MYKFRRKFSVLLIAMLLMLTITGCGGNNETTDGGNNNVATDQVENDGKATDESDDNDQTSGEVVEAVGTLLEVTPIDGGKAELVFEVDGKEITLKADSSELYKFTIGSDYNFSHDGNEIIDFARVEEE